MDIGELERVFGVEPLVLPLPEALPMPIAEPVPTPVPAGTGAQGRD